MIKAMKKINFISNLRNLYKIQILKYHHSYDHNTKEYWALKDKIEEFIQVAYLAQFVKRPDSHVAGARLGGHQKDQHRNHEAEKRRRKKKKKKKEEEEKNRHHHSFRRTI